MTPAPKTQDFLPRRKMCFGTTVHQQLSEWNLRRIINILNSHYRMFFIIFGKYVEDEYFFLSTSFLLYYLSNKNSIRLKILHGTWYSMSIQMILSISWETELQNLSYWHPKTLKVKKWQFATWSIRIYEMRCHWLIAFKDGIQNHIFSNA